MTENFIRVVKHNISGYYPTAFCTLRMPEGIYKVPESMAEAMVNANQAETVSEDVAQAEGYCILTKGDSRFGNDTFGWTKA